jgi:hypothetical protein
LNKKEERKKERKIKLLSTLRGGGEGGRERE